MTAIVPSSYALPLPCRPRPFGVPAKLHATLLLFTLVECAASLRFVASFPLYSLLVAVLCGPIWIGSVLVHEWGHMWVSRRILVGSDAPREMILWPLGGYEFCDGLSRANSRSPEEEDRAPRGSLKDDIKIALAGPLTHIPMGLVWLALYAAINGGDTSRFSFRIYLPYLSETGHGFFSTLFQQACLIQVLLLWFNLFLPVYPADGGRIITSGMLITGVALNKAALVTFFVSILVSIVIFAWTVANFDGDGVGITSIFAILVTLFVWADSQCTKVSSGDGYASIHCLGETVTSIGMHGLRCFR